MNKKQKAKLLESFNELYPDPRSELTFKNNYQLVSAVLLSAQCTDKKVNEVTPVLFKEYPNFKRLGEANEHDVATIIRQVNYYKTKSRHLVAMGQLVTNKHRGRLPTDFDDLIALPGVGRKTANVIQSELGVKPAFPVDTHVFRVSKRLGIAEGKNTDQVEESLKENFPEESWHHLHHWLIFHGRRVCKAQRPLCGDCQIHTLCPSKNAAQAS